MAAAIIANVNQPIPAGNPPGTPPKTRDREIRMLSMTLLGGSSVDPGATEEDKNSWIGRKAQVLGNEWDNLETAHPAETVQEISSRLHELVNLDRR